MKLPVPVPSVVWASAVVGLVLVDQHTPLAVIVPPPASVMFPPDEAVVKLIELTAVVVSVASSTGSVANDTWLP